MSSAGLVNAQGRTRTRTVSNGVVPGDHWASKDSATSRTNVAERSSEGRWRSVTAVRVRSSLSQSARRVYGCRSSCIGLLPEADVPSVVLPEPVLNVLKAATTSDVRICVAAVLIRRIVIAVV